MKQILKTDWERYYTNPIPTCCWSRKVIRRHLLNMLRKANLGPDSSVAELGGGGSCFCHAVQARFGIRNYTVYDSCPAGIASFLRKHPENKAVQSDLLQLEGKPEYDLVFSVGLIEHFAKGETETVTRQHFELAKPGGTVILFFPTPTLLYRMTRSIAECCGLWQFPDERPLLPAEVKAAAAPFGSCLEGHTVYANFLTQYAIIYRKAEQ